MTLYNIKVQPFVKRAKGDWGDGNNNNNFSFKKKFRQVLINCVNFSKYVTELHCLNRDTQLLRENVVPYMTSLIFIFGVALVIAAYGIFRQFFSKPKTA